MAAAMLQAREGAEVDAVSRMQHKRRAQDFVRGRSSVTLTPGLWSRERTHRCIR
jgi:hypothetical protein